MEREIKAALRNIEGYTLYQGVTSLPALPDNVLKLKHMGFEIYGELPDIFKPIDLSYLEAKPLESIPKNGKSWLNHQQVGVEFLLTRNRKGSGVLSWECGAGKTAGALAFLANVDKSSPVLIICPAGIKKQWQYNAKDWIGIKADIIYGQTHNKLKQGNYIINGEILPFWLDALKEVKFQTVVLDEFQKLIGNNKKSEQRKYKGQKEKVKVVTRSGAFFKLVNKKQNVIFMSGTPYNSKPIQLYPALHFLDPETYPNIADFRDRYCKWNSMYGAINYLPGTKNAAAGAELAYLLQKWFYRVEKEDIYDLPPKIRIPLFFEGNRSEYDKLERDLLGANSLDMEQLQMFIKSQAAVDDTVTQAVMEQLFQNNRNNLKALQDSVDALARSAMSIKKEAIVDWISDFLDTDKKFCVYVYHRASGEYLSKAFKKQSVLLLGGMSQKQREGVTDAFKKDKPLLIAQIGTVVGIDGLQDVCADCGFAEMSTAVDVLQAEDRFYRPGQKNKTTSYFFLAEDSVDKYLLEGFNLQLKTFDKLVRTGREASELL